MRQKRWLVNVCENSAELSQVVLTNKNLSSEEANAFLNPKLADFADFSLLADYDKAVARIQLAIERAEKIVIYGDYDVDGISSTSIMFLFLRSLNANVSYYIPNRFSEGYGLNSAALKQIVADCATLVITVDCGISSIVEAELAKELAIDLIITDHHNLAAELPAAYAVVNPKRVDQSYPYKMLCGAGVAFMIAAAFIAKESALYKDLMVLAMIGTIADIMPLTQENRIIVHYGLQWLDETNLIGLKALIDCTGMKAPYSVGQIGFQLAPRLNAAGRLENASIGVELLTSDNGEFVLKTADKLNQLNNQRRDAEKEILARAEKQIADNSQCLESGFVIVWGDDWHEGVIGIVASRLKEAYYLPAIVFSKNGEQLKASARSISDFSIFDALSANKQLLDKFGGHSQAAGLSMNYENLLPLINALREYNNIHLTETVLTPKLNAEANIDAKDINFKNISELENFAPFGVGNSKPIFIINNLRVEAFRRIGKDRTHAKFSLAKNAKLFEALYFSYNERAAARQGSRVDIACQLEVNNFRGASSIQLHLKDIRSYDPYQNKVAKKWYIYYINKLLRLDFKTEFVRPQKIYQRSDGYVANALKKENIVVSSFEGLLELYYQSYDQGVAFESLLDEGAISLFTSESAYQYYDIAVLADETVYQSMHRLNDHEQLLTEVARSKIDRRRFAALYRKIVKLEKVEVENLLLDSDNVFLDSLALLFFEEANFIETKGTSIVITKTEHKKSEFNYSSTNKRYQDLRVILYKLGTYIDRQKF